MQRSKDIPENQHRYNSFAKDRKKQLPEAPSNVDKGQWLPTYETALLCCSFCGRIPQVPL